jgi:GAF domain-containing protein
MTEQIVEILAALEQPGQPDVIFTALDRLTGSLVGHQLFTLLYVDGDEVARVYSNRPVEYAVSGRKPMGRTPWGDLVLKRCKPYLGRDMEGIRWAFFDHALIESMGLGSVINIPVVYDGACLGTMNLLDTEHHYRPEHVAPVAALAPLLIPSFLDARRRVA